MAVISAILFSLQFLSSGGNMLDYDMHDDHCLCCHRLLNGARTIERYQPRPGDITICIYCGFMHQFGKDMRLEAIPPETLAELKNSELWAEIVRCQRLLNNLL